MNFRQGNRENETKAKEKNFFFFSLSVKEKRKEKRKKVLSRRRRRRRRRRKSEECHHPFLTIHLFPSFSFPFLWANRGKTMLTDISLGSSVEHTSDQLCVDDLRSIEIFFLLRWQVSMVRPSPMKRWLISSSSTRWSPAPDVHTTRRRNFSF